MARYSFTIKRRAALKKAQAISAKKRKKFGLKSGRRLSRGHKKAIGAVVAGAIAVGAGTGIWKYTTSRNRKPLQKPPGQASPPVVADQKPSIADQKLIPTPPRPWRYAGANDEASIMLNQFKITGGSADSRVVTRKTTVNHKVDVPIRASGSDAYKSIMREMHGKPVPGGGKKAKYNVFEVSDEQWEAEGRELERKMAYGPEMRRGH